MSDQSLLTTTLIPMEISYNGEGSDSSSLSTPVSSTSTPIDSPTSKTSTPIPTSCGPDPDDRGPYMDVKPSLARLTSMEERQMYQSKPSLLNCASFHPSVVESTVEGTTPHPRLGRMNRDKFNSTSTIFMATAMCAPDVCEIIICLSRVLCFNINKLEFKNSKRFIDIFDEALYPLGDGGECRLDRLPTEREIQRFLFVLFDVQELSAECGVMAAAYIERLVKLTGVTLHPSNWRRIVLGALLLSTKVWEDLAVWNVDFLNTFPNLSLHDLNRLEREFLTYLKFTVALNASVYAKYYFDLRSLSDRREDFFPLKPLDALDAERLEAKSRGVEESVKIQHIHAQRAFSLDHYQHKVRLSLEELQQLFGKNWKEDITH